MKRGKQREWGGIREQKLQKGDAARGIGGRRGGNRGGERIGDLGGRTMKKGEDYERNRKERKDGRTKRAEEEKGGGRGGEKQKRAMKGEEKGLKEQYQTQEFK